jgi:septal ring factor EnvC (AmiA/AmiB activator)
VASRPRSAPNRRGAIVRAALPALAAAALAFAVAAQEGPPAASAAEREQELLRVRAEIGRLQRELDGLSRRESGAAGELERIGVELALQRERVAEAQAARELARQRLAGSEAELARLGEELEATRAELRRRLVGLYRLGRHGYLRLVLSVEPGSDPLEAFRVLRFLVRRDARAIDRYTAVRERVARERDLAAGWRAEAESWVGREETRGRELARLLRRQELLVARLGGERRALAEQAARLEDREAKLSNFLDFLYGRGAAPLSGRPIQEFRGVLDWPVAGRVTQGFGPRLDPRYGTRVPHNGVELAVATPGAAVEAVYPGKVLFAAPFRGYGPTVIVHHPGRVFTLYAGLAELSVGRDAVVALGAVLGTAADTLYFEIRVENRPEDPRAWLR